nr:substrate-binding domain-containing protein [Tessaracoccus coleopterorum]
MNLTPEVLAKVFRGDIASWNDPAIAALNPGVTFPDQAITPVHRSDESGTTENFTDYLAVAAEGVWTDEKSQEWPIDGGEAAKGTSGVVAAVTGGRGTIGYADASQAGTAAVAKIGPEGRFEAPTEEAAAAAVENSPSRRGAPRATSPSSSTAWPRATRSCSCPTPSPAPSTRTAPRPSS